MNEQPILVYGDGSASAFLVQQLVAQQQKVIWAAGSGARLMPIQPNVKSDLALALVLQAQNFLAHDIGQSHPIEKGLFHRVYRNKGFKLPVWKKGTSLDHQTEAFEELVWKPEQPFLGVQEFRIASRSVALIEDELRLQLETHPLVQMVPPVAILELEIFEKGGKVQFANGFTTEFKQLYFCDSLSELHQIPKLASALKHQVATVRPSNMMSALQVIFHHSVPLKQTFETGMIVPLNRDSGESFDRDALGYFLSPERSIWTVFLQASEVEDNHEIMKKLRKMKQALNRAFDEPEFLPEGKKDFLSTVEKEVVRFEPAFVAVEGQFREAGQQADLILMTGCMGLTVALESVAKRFGIEPVDFMTDAGLVMDLEVGNDAQQAEL
jgi:hypothetical protein